jgi:branched-chain amino acid transport system substrate-binding protein
MKTRNIKLGLALLLSVVFVLTIAACDSGAAPTSGRPILIGGVNDLSGPRSVTGSAINQGVILAIEHLNARGGLLGGRPIEYIVYDNRNDPQETINSYTRLVEVDGVSAVISTDASAIFLGLIEISNELQVPILGNPSDPRATIDMDTGIPHGFTFLVAQPNAINQSQIVVNYVMNETDWRKAALFYDQTNAFTVVFTESFERFWLEAGGEIVARETINAGDQDFRTQLSRINASGADFIMTPNPTAQLVIMANQAAQLGMTLPYAGCADMSDPFLDLVNDPTQITAVVHAPLMMNDPKLDEFTAQYMARFNVEPQTRSVYGYDGMMILAAAIEAAGSDDPIAIRDALKNDIRGLSLLISNNYSMDPNTHAPLDLGLIIMMIENGVQRLAGEFL